MAQFTFVLDGIFDLNELGHLTSQVEKIGPETHERMKAAGFEDRYDYKIQAAFKNARRFKGKVTIVVEEIASVELPLPEAEAVDEDAA